MKTLREIQNDVAKDWGYESYIDFMKGFRNGKVNFIRLGMLNNRVNELIQRQAQHKINKRIEDDYLNDNFDTTSIINDNNLIR